MLVLAIDPGPTKCGCVIYDSDSERVIASDVISVADALHDLRDGVADRASSAVPHALAVECFEARGMPLGNESMETLIVTGRILEAWGNDATAHRVKRSAVKLHLCGSNRAKDSNVNAALLDRFGGANARGTKVQPGPLYGVTSHAWAALAVAVTFADTEVNR